MSCGLRPIQSAKTITWFSDRSGIASTGVCSTAYKPHSAIPSQTRITSQRLRTENSMMREITSGASHCHPERSGEAAQSKDLAETGRNALPRKWRGSRYGVSDSKKLLKVKV